jgi:ABC-type antimicrobial peptide transport system permease subunit
MFIESCSMAIENIMQNRLRSFLTVLGIMIGVTAVIALITTINGVSNSISTSFLDMGAGTISLSTPGSDAKEGLSAEDMQRIAEGIELEDGAIKADAIEYADETDKKQVGIEIHSGRNRIVRRIFEHLGYKVRKLDRVYFAGLTKKNVRRGDWRFLTEAEVNMLYTGMFE